MVNHPIDWYSLTVSINDLDLGVDCAVVSRKVVEALNYIVRIARGVSA